MPKATIRHSVVGFLVIVALAVTVWSPVAQAGPMPTPTATPTATATPTVTPTAACMANDDCATEEFCRTEPGACGGIGMCEQRAEICTLEFDPVCGCDGSTYGNDCEAARAGVSIAFAGSCGPTPNDTDGDGVPDVVDNCIAASNPDQDDSDGDLCGNQCDADYNQDSVVSILDFGTLRNCFNGAFEEVCDHAPERLDGVISIQDFGIFRQQFLAGVPGPGRSAACDGLQDV